MSRPFEVDLFKNMSTTSVYKLLSTYNVYIAALNFHFVRKIFGDGINYYILYMLTQHRERTFL